MTSEQFTPGPWVVRSAKDDYEMPTIAAPRHLVMDAISNTKARVGAFVPVCAWVDDKANANMIAAAPDLYAACKAIAELRDLVIGGVINPRQLIPAMNYCWAAAIKARGSQ